MQRILQYKFCFRQNNKAGLNFVERGISGCTIASYYRFSHLLRGKGGWSWNPFGRKSYYHYQTHRKTYLLLYWPGSGVFLFIFFDWNLGGCGFIAICIFVGHICVTYSKNCKRFVIESHTDFCVANTVLPIWIALGVGLA